MKKKLVYMQTCVMNEATKLFTTQEIADAALKYLNKKKELATVYETGSDGFVLRRTTDDMLLDTELANVITKGIKDLIKDSDDFVDIIFDNYDFDYKKDILSDDYVATILNIHRNGRLVMIEIDMQ